MSVETQGRVVYWDPVAMSRRTGATLCFLHATEVNLAGSWTICDRRGRHPVIHVPPIEWETLRQPSEWPTVPSQTPSQTPSQVHSVGSMRAPSTPPGSSGHEAAFHQTVSVPAAPAAAPAAPGLDGSERDVGVAADVGYVLADRSEPPATHVPTAEPKVMAAPPDAADVTAPTPPPMLRVDVRAPSPWWAHPQAREHHPAGKGAAVTLGSPKLNPQPSADRPLTGSARTRRPAGPLLKRAFEGPTASGSKADDSPTAE